MDTFANQLQAMVTKMQSFLNTMTEFAVPPAIERLEKQVEAFNESAVPDMVESLMDFVSKVLDAKLPAPGDPKDEAEASTTPPGQVQAHLQSEDPSPDAPDADSFLTGTVRALMTVAATLQQALPGVLDNLIFARQEVSSVAGTMRSTFGTLKGSGPPIFEGVAHLYKSLWVTYFWFFSILTSSMLFYGFWASGFFSSSDGVYVDDYEPPRTVLDRFRTLYGSCHACCRACHDDHLCLWSFVLLMQVVVVVLFWVSVFVCVMSGIKTFMSAGCAQIYFLGDAAVCGGVLQTIRSWLTTFWVGGGETLGTICKDKELLFCDLIGRRLQVSVRNTVLASVLASVLSLQLVLESAILHERARWRAFLEERGNKARA